jgi:hypothetical protein
MKTINDIDLRTIALIAGTRAILGIGIGLLLAGRFAPETRKAIGWSLIGLGGLSTIPLASEVLHRIQPDLSAA